MTDHAMTLGEAFEIPDVITATDFVLQLSAGVEQAEQTVGQYVVTESLAHAFDRSLDLLGVALEQQSSKGAFIHGSFGSGKSHFMAVLDLILRGSPQARALPGLQEVISKHQDVLGKKYLTVEYHLNGMPSFEHALFSGYLATIAREHPGAPLPQLHQSDPVIDNARSHMAQVGTEAFLAQLNAGASSPWGAQAGNWDEASLLAAMDAPAGDLDRERLMVDLIDTVFPAYRQMGEWVDVATGLERMAAHAKSLGYDAMVLFLDELVLWLASRLADQDFVATEGSKVANLVEAGAAIRDLPILSLVARQRELQDFLGDGVINMPGAQRLAVGDAFRWWEGRFDRIDLAAADLPKIAHQRLLKPRDEAAAAQIGAALAEVKTSKAWDVLLTAEDGGGEEHFSAVYPFSPALVETLVTLSSMLQRERTALKLMAQLMVAGKDSLLVTDIIPAGDLYDVLVEGGDTPLTEDMRRRFDIARALYREKLRPALLSGHGLTEAEAEGLDRDAAFSRDDRLAKTLIIAALAPDTPALRNLTASKLAALNHGTVRVRIAGQETPAVLTKVRQWAQTVGELQVGDGGDPTIRLELSGVDYGAILERVANEDTEGARRTQLRRLLFDDLGISDEGNLMAANSYPLVWRGSRREIDVVFGNIRDTDDIPDASFIAEGDRWRVILDFPFDPQGQTPADDHVRMDRLRVHLQTRTVAWIPGFLTAARMDDLGRFVKLEYLLRGDGAAFHEHAAHLAPEHRTQARTQLESMRNNLRTTLREVLKQAYGVATQDPANIDINTYGQTPIFASLDADFVPQAPIGADLGQALGNLADQMLASQFPEHPRFEPADREVTRANINVVLEQVQLAVADAHGRVDRVESAKRRALNSVAGPLGIGVVGENHFTFTAATFDWRNRFTRRAAEDQVSDAVPVARVREWLAPYGLSLPLQNLLILCWALLDDKEFARHNAAVSVKRIDDVRDEYVLRAPVLPDDDAWNAARARAVSVFGVTVAEVKSVANVRRLADAVGEKARGFVGPARALLDALFGHANTLGLGGEQVSNRMADAEAAAQLVEKLANARDSLTLVHALAQAPLPAEPQSVARSLSSAADVAAAMDTAAWEVLDSVASQAGPDDSEAQTIINNLCNVARQSELHASLPPALRKAGTAATAVLTGRRFDKPAPVTQVAPVPTPGPAPLTEPDRVTDNSRDPTMAGQLDGIALDDLDSQLDQVGESIREAAANAQRGARISIHWHIT